MGWSKDPGPSQAGKTLAFFIIMKELSIFVDESGDFGTYDYHSPYYIIAFVFHDQEKDISKELAILNGKLSVFGFETRAVHTGPIIRMEEEFSSMTFEVRQKIMRALISFYRNVDIQYTAIHVEKKHIDNELEIVSALSRKLSRFISAHLDYFLSFDSVKIYYDNGQIPVTRILSSVFGIYLMNVQFKKAVMPSKYRLFQIADMICSLELIRLKMSNHLLSKSELHFFGEPRVIRRKYLRIIDDKKMK